MEEYSDRRSKTEIAFRRRGSRLSYQNQSPEERTNHNNDGLGSSTRLNPTKAGITDNQEGPRYLHDSFKSSSSKVVPASSSKFPLRKFEEKRRQPLLAGVDIAESGRRKAEAKQLQGSKKILVDDESSDTLRTESEGSTTEQGRLLTPGSEGSHFTGPSGVYRHRAESLVRTAPLNSRTHGQKEKEANLGTPGACSSYFTDRSTMPRNSTTGVRPAYGHASGVHRGGLKNPGCTSVPDVQAPGFSSDSIYNRRFELMRKRASDPESSSRSRSFSGPSNSGHSPPSDIFDTGTRIRMNEQSLSQQIIRSSNRNQQESAVSVRTRQPSHATTLRAPNERADSMLSLHESSTRNGPSAPEHLSLEEVSAESSIRPFFVELPHDIYSSSRHNSSNTRAERGRPSSLFEESPPQMLHGLIGERNGHRSITMGGIAEVLLALPSTEQEVELTYEQLLVLETNLFLGAFASHDRHRDMRMNIDNMSYEELLALEERIGSVSTALSDEQFAKCLRRSIYCPAATGVNKSVIDDMKCNICQEEYKKGDEVGRLPCEHRYHVCCIGQWLRQKNWCPFCLPRTALPSNDLRRLPIRLISDGRPPSPRRPLASPCLGSLLLPALILLSSAAYSAEESTTRVLSVGEELVGETLPLRHGRRVYRIAGPRPSAWYQVKISYPASIPSSFSIRLVEDPDGADWSSKNRRLLNTEKIIFKAEGSSNPVYVLVTVEPEGVVAKPDVPEREHALFNIVCDELMLGLPVFTWWVGIAARLCIVLALLAPVVLPLHKLLNKYEGSDLRKTDAAKMS